MLEGVGYLINQTETRTRIPKLLPQVGWATGSSEVINGMEGRETGEQRMSDGRDVGGIVLDRRDHDFLKIGSGVHDTRSFGGNGCGD
jgi:hypothetical protein